MGIKVSGSREAMHFMFRICLYFMMSNSHCEQTALEEKKQIQSKGMWVVLLRGMLMEINSFTLWDVC